MGVQAKPPAAQSTTAGSLHRFYQGKSDKVARDPIASGWGSGKEPESDFPGAEKEQSGP